MRRSRITITLETNLLKKIDRLIDKKKIRNRSHAIEYIVTQYTQSSVNKAIILAGGRGTQLRPYTYEIPKSMLPVGGKPIIEHLIEQLKANNITDIIIAISYLGDKIKKYFGDGSRFGVNITYSEEQEDLMTGGALSRLKDQVGQDTFLVVHGDIMSDFSFSDFIQFHKEQSTSATVALTTNAEPTAFGQIKLQGTHLTKFYLNTDGAGTKSHLIHTGIYAFEPTIFNEFPKDRARFSLEDVIQHLVSKQEVSGFVFEGSWYDVGNPENYEKAIKEYNKE